MLSSFARICRMLWTNDLQVVGSRVIRNSFVVGGAVFALLSPVCSRATIVSGIVTGGSVLSLGGTFVKLTPPLSNPFGPTNSVGNDNFQSNNLFGFDEDQNILITAPITADVGLSPIPAGTTVASHYIFFDPGPAETVIGRVNFDSNVLAIFTSTGTLAASDFLAKTGVNYLNPTQRGLEAGDSVTISGPQQILFNTAASSPGDYVRVLTEFSPAAAAPEPATWMNLGLGSGCLALLCLRRKTGRYRAKA